MKGAQVILVSENCNEMGRFAHKKFAPEDLVRAIKICQNGASPFVVYGDGTTQKDAEKLVVLKRKAQFIFPATNGYRARCYPMDQQSSNRNDLPWKMPHLRMNGLKELKTGSSWSFIPVTTAPLRRPPMWSCFLLWYEQEGSPDNPAARRLLWAAPPGGVDSRE
jgi:hypothetical protein